MNASSSPEYIEIVLWLAMSICVINKSHNKPQVFSQDEEIIIKSTVTLDWILKNQK